MHTSQEGGMGDHGTFGVACGTWSVAEHIHWLWLRLLKDDLNMLVSDSNHICKIESSDAKFSCSFPHFLIELIEAYHVLDQVDAAVLPQFHESVEWFLLADNSGELCLIQDVCNCIYTKTLEERNNCNVGSHACKICNGPFFSVLANDTKEAVSCAFSELLRAEAKVIHSYIFGKFSAISYL